MHCCPVNAASSLGLITRGFVGIRQPSRSAQPACLSSTPLPPLVVAGVTDFKAFVRSPVFLKVGLPGPSSPLSR